MGACAHIINIYEDAGQHLYSRVGQDAAGLLALGELVLIGPDDGFTPRTSTAHSLKWSDVVMQYSVLLHYVSFNNDRRSAGTNSRPTA